MTHAHQGTLPLNTLLTHCTVGREILHDPVASRVSMVDKGDDGVPKVQGTTSDQPAEDGETAALIRQLLAALKKQQEKPGNSSKGKP